MAFDVARLRLLYSIGLWRLPQAPGQPDGEPSSATAVTAGPAYVEMSLGEGDDGSTSNGSVVWSLEGGT